MADGMMLGTPGPWRSRGYLPHWEAGETAQMIGFRLADSLPAALLERWQVELDQLPEGDATLQTGIHLLFRATPLWAFGAGALFGPSPTSDNQYGGLGGLRRTHSRSYLLLGGDVRYFPVTLKWVEFWVGLTGGGVVIADRFTTDDAPSVPTILGTKDVTVRTEGLAVGAQAGVDWMFADRFVAGLALRGDRWFLPNTPGCTSIGDCATLVGVVSAIEVGLTLGYRIPL